MISFARQEFSAAAADLRQSQVESFLPLVELAEEYAKQPTPLTDEELLDLFARLQKIPHNTAIKIMTSERNLQQQHLPPNMDFISKVLKMQNSRYTRIQFKLNNRDLSLKGSKHLYLIHALQNLDLQSLDISGTYVNDLQPLNGMSLERLNAHRTRVYSVKPLMKMPLKWLDLSGTWITDLKPIRKCPIEHLVLPEARIDSIYHLKKMPKLKSLSLPDNVYSNTVINDLRQKYKVSIRP